MKIKPDYLDVLDYGNFCLENAGKKVRDDVAITTYSSASKSIKQRKNEETKNSDKLPTILKNRIHELDNLLQKQGSEETDFKTTKNNDVLDVGTIND